VLSPANQPHFSCDDQIHLLPNDLFHHIQELKIMKTLIKQAGKILFILFFFISLSDKNYAQRIQVIDFPTTDPNNLDLMLLGTEWKVPQKVVSIKIQAWGTGGAGGGGTKANGRGGGGGGGGAYCEFVKTTDLSGSWWFLCGPGPEGITGRLKHGESSWVNFDSTTHPNVLINNGVEANGGDGGDKADGKIVVPGGQGGQEAASYFPNWGGYGGVIIAGTDGDESSATSSGKGGNSLNGGAGGVTVTEKQLAPRPTYMSPESKNTDSTQNPGELSDIETIQKMLTELATEIESLKSGKQEY
jgi:hypothetical protein